MKSAMLFIALLAATPAAAENSACAKLEDPLAYNACLARNGPAARAVHMGAAPTRGAPSRGAARSFAPATRRGRSEMVFPVGK